MVGALRASRAAAGAAGQRLPWGVGALSAVARTGRQRVVLGKAHSEAVMEVERKVGKIYSSGMEGSKERAVEVTRTDGRSLHPGNLPVDWYTLNRWVLEEKMEQVREIEGERAYEEMRRNVERARQPVRTSQFPSCGGPERGPERNGPERDYGPSR